MSKFALRVLKSSSNTHYPAFLEHCHINLLPQEQLYSKAQEYSLAFSKLTTVALWELYFAVEYHCFSLPLINEKANSLMCH